MGNHRMLHALLAYPALSSLPYHTRPAGSSRSVAGSSCHSGDAGAGNTASSCDWGRQATGCIARKLPPLPCNGPGCSGKTVHHLCLELACGAKGEARNLCVACAKKAGILPAIAAQTRVPAVPDLPAVHPTCHQEHQHAGKHQNQSACSHVVHSLPDDACCVVMSLEPVPGSTALYFHEKSDMLCAYRPVCCTGPSTRVRRRWQACCCTCQSASKPLR